MGVALLQLGLPAIAISLFVAFKLNHKQKGFFFKIPVLISSTILAFLIGHAATGVMGFYGAIICDLLLFPVFLLIKKTWERKEAKTNPEFAMALEQRRAKTRASKETLKAQTQWAKHQGYQRSDTVKTS